MDQQTWRQQGFTKMRSQSQPTIKTYKEQLTPNGRLKPSSILTTERIAHDGERASGLAAALDREAALDLERKFDPVSPFLRYIVQDPSYLNSPAAERKSKRTKQQPRPASARTSRSRIKTSRPSSKHAKESTEAALMRLVKTLRAENSRWKIKFKQEAKTRKTIKDLSQTLSQNIVDSNKKVNTLQQEKIEITLALTHQLKEMSLQEQKARRKANHFRHQYVAKGMKQVNTALECQIVNCAYRKIALSHKKQIDDLKHLHSEQTKTIQALVDTATKSVLTIALKPRDQPKAMHSGFVLPLSLHSLPTKGASTGKASKKQRGPVKHWSLKRTLQELSPVLSTKIDSDRRCDAVKIRRQSLPEHFKSFYLKQEGTVTSSLQKLGKVIHDIMHHLNESESKDSSNPGKGKNNTNNNKNHSQKEEQKEAMPCSPLITIVTTALGLKQTTLYSARLSHAMLGLMARLSVSEYGLQVTSEMLSATDITVGSVLRVVIMRAALQGEDTLQVRMDVAVRMLRYTFPVVARQATCPDRLCLHLNVYEKLVTKLCSLYQIDDNTEPFVNAIRYEINKNRKKVEKTYMSVQKQKFSTTTRQGKGGGMAEEEHNGDRETKEDWNEDEDNRNEKKTSEEKKEQDKKNAVSVSEKEKKMLLRVHDLPKKTRQLLLQAAKNKSTLKNLFEIFDEDGSGAIDETELRIAMSNCGVQLNRKETKRLMYIIDEDGDGELQFEEYFFFVEAVAKDEKIRSKMLGQLAWTRKQQQLKKERREKRKKRQLQRSLLVTKATAAFTAKNSGDSKKLDAGHKAITSIYNFVNGNTLDEDISSSEEEDQEIQERKREEEEEENEKGLPLATLEDVVVEYLEHAEKQTDHTVVVEAPMFQIILAALNAFLEQEQLNYDSLISFYDKTMGKDNENLTLTQFTDLIELMTLKNTESEERLYPEEITNLYQDAACLIPDDTRVDNTKFAMVAMSRGLIPSRFDYF